MFVYQNVNRDICVTFKSNKPVVDPEYVIAINHEAGTLTVNGQLMVASEEATDVDVTEDTTPVTEELVEEDEAATEDPDAGEPNNSEEE